MSSWTTTSRSGDVPVEGGSLRYTMEGSGPPILVLGSTSYYRRTFSPGLRLRARLVFVDVRHFGRLEPGYDPVGTSLETYARHMERVRAEIGLGSAIVLGHSHHGRTAMPEQFSLHVFDRSGHTPQLEEPEAFDRILMEWLDGRRPTGEGAREASE